MNHGSMAALPVKIKLLAPEMKMEVSPNARTALFTMALPALACPR
jgi:hypothetical protein